MEEFQLSTVSFHPLMEENHVVRKNYCIYVKEPSVSYSQDTYSFFDALQLSKDSPNTSDGNWRSISTNNHQAVELHFRSRKNQRVISVTINLPSYQLDISSYVWYQNRKAYLKLDYPEKHNDQILKNLLQRIFVKHKRKASFLSLLDLEEGIPSAKTN